MTSLATARADANTNFAARSVRGTAQLCPLGKLPATWHSPRKEASITPEQGYRFGGVRITALHMATGKDDPKRPDPTKYFEGVQHLGLDLGESAAGQPVYAIGDGEVIRTSGGPKNGCPGTPEVCKQRCKTVTDEAGTKDHPGPWPSGWGCGNYAVLIRHHAKGESFVAVYGHIRPTACVRTVRRGDVIGYIGPYKGGNHLHFGIHPGEKDIAAPLGLIALHGGDNGFVDPAKYLLNHPPADKET